MDKYWTCIVFFLDYIWNINRQQMEIPMAEVRVQLPDEVVERLQKQLGGNAKLTDIARDAFSMFNWAVEERAKGRVVLSTDPQGEKPTRLAMPRLDNVSKQSE
jgi:hypothetical protein